MQNFFLHFNNSKGYEIPKLIQISKVLQDICQKFSIVKNYQYIPIIMQEEMMRGSLLASMQHFYWHN